MSRPRFRPLTVWAPRARHVELVTAQRRVSLRAAADGHHELTDETVDLTHDYWLSLDGGEPLPDPRSEHQPEGIAGPSRRVDHSAFAWDDDAFRAVPLGSGIVYELHVGTFSEAGTFEGAIARLEHLVELGVTHVELMPVCEFAGRRGWGYDGVNLFAPHHDYGGPLGLKRLVNACHARGLAVLLDVVYNHLGPRGNHLARFGPYFTEGHTPWGAAVNLRAAGSDAVRRFFVDNALLWLEDYHFDGLRLDAVQAMDDDRAFPFLAELAREIETAGAKHGKRWELVAECDRSDPRTTRPLAQGGLGMNAQWSDDFGFALHAFFTGEHNGRLQDFGDLAAVAHVLENGFRHQGSFSKFRGRAHGHPFERPAEGCVLGYVQTHDQVGNRPRGERFSMLVSPEVVRQAAALVLLGPFVPMLFQGEEWAASTPFLYFTDHGEPGLAREVKEGREREYLSLGFALDGSLEPESEAAFTRSRLCWDERDEPEHRAVFEWYRALVGLRRQHVVGRQLPTAVVFDPAGGFLVVDRERLMIALSFSDEPRELSLQKGGEPVLVHGDVEVRADRLRLGPRATIVLGRDT